MLFLHPSLPFSLSKDFLSKPSWLPHLKSIAQSFMPCRTLLPSLIISNCPPILSLRISSIYTCFSHMRQMRNSLRKQWHLTLCFYSLYSPSLALLQYHLAQSRPLINAYLHQHPSIQSKVAFLQAYHFFNDISSIRNCSYHVYIAYINCLHYYVSIGLSIFPK